MTKKLKVYLNQTFVGLLSLEPQNELTFQYHQSWLDNKKSFPLSLSLSLRKNKFLHSECFSFFDGLLPESIIRDSIAKRLGVSPKNTFALLSEIGKECAGALSFWLRDEEVNFREEYQLLTNNELQERLTVSSNHPLLLQKNGVRLSLAGAQEKTVLFFKKNQWYLPLYMAPSSHILKPTMSDFEFTVENEAFCMALAKQCELNVPPTEIMYLKNKAPIFVTQRFDRVLIREDKLERRHQEDFCQALGYYSDTKYEAEGGPSFKDCFELLNHYTLDPLGNRKQLLLWVLFNYCVGNCDAHAKNVAWFIDSTGYHLAPFYDLMSTQAYAELTKKMAMKIGGENRIEWITKRHWERLAEDIKIKKNYLMELAKEFAKKIIQESQNLSQTWGPKQESHLLIKKIVTLILQNAKRVEF